MTYTFSVWSAVSTRLDGSMLPSYVYRSPTSRPAPPLEDYSRFTWEYDMENYGHSALSYA